MKTAATADTTPTNAPWAAIALVATVVFCLTPYASPGIALGAGLLLALTLGNPCPHLTKRINKPLLQISVVLLGFGMNLNAMLDSARQGFVIALATITVTFLLGLALRRMLALKQSTAVLVSAGTAICGGSAIATVALTIGAAEAEISIAMGTVFLLNAVALYLFPVMGHAMHLSQAQFGAWSGIAIHDVSSVIGAASAYGPEALQTATIVKLSRTLWIIPVALIAGWLIRPSAGTNAEAADAPDVPVTLKRRLPIPWFIALFVLASVIGTFVTPMHEAIPSLQRLARVGMTLTLLLIGLTLSRDSLKSVGVRPILLGLALWLVISVTSLVALRSFAL
jgi:uncharacterized integral membrane protein (TIGR00698 family)